MRVVVCRLSYTIINLGQTTMRVIESLSRVMCNSIGSHEKFELVQSQRERMRVMRLHES